MSLAVGAVVCLAVGLGILVVLGLCRSAAMDSDLIDEDDDAEYGRRS